jgi:hypothetical protein
MPINFYLFAHSLSESEEEEESPRILADVSPHFEILSKKSGDAEIVEKRSLSKLKLMLEKILFHSFFFASFPTNGPQTQIV